MASLVRALQQLTLRRRLGGRLVAPDPVASIYAPISLLVGRHPPPACPRSPLTLHGTHALPCRGYRFGHVVRTGSRSGGGRSGGRPLMNEDITARTVRLVMPTEDGGTSSELVSRQEALAAARRMQLDLVVVAPRADPVVCKIMDFGAEQYRKKKAAKAKPRQPQLKQIRMKGLIESHDRELKMKKVLSYLGRGDQVKITLMAQGAMLRRSPSCLDKLQATVQENLDPAKVNVELLAKATTVYRRELLLSPRQGAFS